MLRQQIRNEETSAVGTLSFYNSHASEYFASTVHLKMDELYQPFLDLIPAGGHILDAGAGSGRDTKSFLNKGYRVTAVEPASALADLADKFTGQQPIRLAFCDMQFNKEFDGIWSCASLLHIPKTDIVEVLDRFTRALKPKGVIYLSLKEGKGESTAEDGRFFAYYSIPSFQNILAKLPQLTELRSWRSLETRSRSHDMPWINFLLQKR
jgi:2-polyprenyl-3-methyl-5-hydroxy-6-metoxy-1,4-benzoquinol methylase